MALPNPPMSTSQFVNAIDKGIRKHTDDQFKQKMPKRDKIFNIAPQEDALQEEMEYAGFGQVEDIAEGGMFPLDTTPETYKTTYVPLKSGTSVSITKEMIKYDKVKLSDASKLASKLVDALVDSQEARASNVLNNSFSTSALSYGDNRPFISTLHTRIDGGGNRSNASASGIPLTHTNLDIAVTQQREQVNHRGKLISVSPKTIVVPPALLQEALVITKSTLKSGTADNDANVFNGMSEYSDGAYNVICWDYLAGSAGGSDTAWFIFDPSKNNLNWKDGWKPEITYNDKIGGRTQEFYWFASYQSSTGWGDPVAWWGSKGDGLAYAS